MTTMPHIAYGDRREPNDCGVVALATMTVAMTGQTVEYVKALEHLRKRDIYDEGGCNTMMFMNHMKWMFSRNSRLSWGNGRTTIAEYVAKRGRWTGFVIGVASKPEEPYILHAMAVIKGEIYNADEDCRNGEFIVSLRVL